MFFQADSFLITNRWTKECWFSDSSTNFSLLRFMSSFVANGLFGSFSLSKILMTGLYPYLIEADVEFGSVLLLYTLGYSFSTVVIPNRIFLLYSYFFCLTVKLSSFFTVARVTEETCTSHLGSCPKENSDA